MKTPICDLLNIEYPIIQSGMFDVAGPELVAAVCNAGGLGILSATMLLPEVLLERIKKIRQLTSRPFGVNLLLQQDLFPPRDYEISDELNLKVHDTLNEFRRQLRIPENSAKPEKVPPLIQSALEIILQEKIPVFSVGLGNPSKEIVAQCHKRGMKVMVMIATVEDAITVSKNGVDIIVAQGSEAGGHRSTWEKKISKEYASIGTLSLTSAVAKAVNVPVVAAGGIVNGKGLKAALSIGAQGVLMGTRFIATTESIAPESYKRKVLEGSSDNTTVTDSFTGMYARVIRNKYTERYHERNTPVFPPGRQFMANGDIIKAAKEQNNPEFYTLYAGQGISEIREMKSAYDVVKEIIAEAEAK